MTTVAASAEQSQKRVILASLIGTVIEFYDFYIYLIAALLVFPQLFFPTSSFAVAQLTSLATFCLAFFARPVGAVIFGHFGDRYGRRKPLIASLLVMGIATFLIGCLPTTNVFVGAPFLLVLLRLAQGIALGGEWAGSALIAAENSPKHRRGLYGTLPQFGIPLGFFFAIGSFVILYLSLPREVFFDYGWRIPFLVSLALLVLGLALRAGITETQTYQKLREQEQPLTLPLMHALRTMPFRMLRGIGVMLAPYMILYFVVTFALSYASAPAGEVSRGQKSGLGFDIIECLIMLMIGTLFYAATVAITGLLADRLGRKRALLAGLSLTAIFGFSFAIWLQNATSNGSLQLFLIVAFVITGFASSPLGAYLPELFPTNIRYTASAITYNFASIICGGILPLVGYGLWQRNGTITDISLLLGIIAIVSLLCLLGAHEFKDYDLHSIPLKNKAFQPEVDREEGFTVLELLVVIGVVLALALVAIPLYLNARANSVSDSVEDSVHDTQEYVSQDILVNFRAQDFDETTLPPRDIVSYDQTTVLVTGPAGSGEGSLSGYEIRAYNANSSKYKDPRTAYVYVSTTGSYGSAAALDSSSL